MTTAITSNAVTQAAIKLDRMRSSLVGWLKYRAINDGVLAGAVATKLPLAVAQQEVRAARSSQREQALANQLQAILAVRWPSAALPNPNLAANPQGAVQLAQLAISGNTPGLLDSSSQALSGVLSMAGPWMWPVAIVGGLLIVVVTAITSAADVAKDAEEKACIRAGACTDYGFWLRSAAVVGIAWFAWDKLGVGDRVTKLIKGRS